MKRRRQSRAKSALPKGAYRLPTGGYILPATSATPIGRNRQILVTAVLRDEPDIHRLAMAVVRFGEQLGPKKPKG